MANEMSARSYRDFDAYERREGVADELPRPSAADPLAELARIMGQDDIYADLLKSAARGREGEPPQPAADEESAAPLDGPHLDLRGSHDPDSGAVTDWDDLEAELESYARSGAQPREAAAGPFGAFGEGEAEERLRAEREAGGLSDAELERLISEELAAGEVSEAALGAAAGAGLAAGAAALRANRRAGRAPQAGAGSFDAHDGHLPLPDPALFEEEAPPRRRRAGVTAIAAVVGLAVLGGGSVLGYRALTGGSGAGEPRVIRASGEPVRVAAPQAQDPKPAADRASGENRVVSREERPMSAREQAAQAQPPAPPAAPRQIPLGPAPAAEAPAVRSVQAVPVAPRSGAAVAALRPSATDAASSGLAPPPAEEPRRVRTVPVGPDGQILPVPRPAQAAPVQPAPTHSAPSQPLSVEPVAPAASEAAPAGEARTAPLPPPRPAALRVARAETAEERARPAAGARPGAVQPLDLAPQRTASVRAGGPATTFVQISSHPSEAEALRAFSEAQRRYPMLQGQTANIRTAELPGRGTWHRLRVGPFSRTDAQSFCERLRNAGGSCVLN